MLDLREILERSDAVKANLRRRGFDVSIIDTLSQDGRRRSEIIQQVEQLKSKRNDVSKQIGVLKKQGQNADDMVREMGVVGDNIKKLDQELSNLEASLNDRLMRLPNLIDESVPDGKEATDNQEIRKWGTPRSFSFTPKNHDELGEASGLLDFTRAAKVSGARFSVLWGDASRLERALIQFMLDVHTRDHGYTEVLPPFIVNATSMFGTGQLPKFREELFHLESKDFDYFLIPTAEVPVTNLHGDEILEEESLPRAYCAYTPCFRSEAGSYGKDTKGLIRQHQFNKVELVRFSHPDKSMEQLELLTGHAEEILKRLELPYRTMALCAGDIGNGSRKTYDLEVWLPGQKAYREISSCSNFWDFQARRAKIRYRSKETKKVQLLHTLNGSGLAVGRTLVAIFENYQDEAGKIAIPKALQPYMAGLTHLRPHR
jgi:seryl-tRNA synthetase